MTTVTIERLGHQGDGIADGPVFVSRSLPGEIVSGTLEGTKLTSPRILQPSPDRVSPPCQHFRACGGCALQHASDSFVADWKVSVVRKSLEAHGLESPIRRLHISPQKSRRRAVFGGRKTKKGALVGFHAPGSDVLQAIPNCQLLRHALIEALPFLEELVRVGGSRKGEVRLTVTETETGLDIAISDAKPMDMQLSQAVIEIADSASAARLTWNGEQVATLRRPVVTFGTAPVTPPPGAFLQATREGEAALMASVREAVEQARTIIDLFSGCGTFSLPLAQVAEVHAVESEAEMLTALDEGWRHVTDVHRVTTEVRDLFRRPLMHDELAKADAVVIDPPRAGAESQIREIAKSAVPRIASVSCNPVTFARDSAILTAAGYRCLWVDVVDQFRWSPHVEIVSAFER